VCGIAGRKAPIAPESTVEAALRNVEAQNAETGADALAEALEASSGVFSS
jgi:hypothetical protein